MLSYLIKENKEINMQNGVCIFALKHVKGSTFNCAFWHHLTSLIGSIWYGTINLNCKMRIKAWLHGTWLSEPDNWIAVREGSHFGDQGWLHSAWFIRIYDVFGSSKRLWNLCPYLFTMDYIQNIILPLIHCGFLLKIRKESGGWRHIR